MIKNIAVGRVPRGFSLSPDGDAAVCDQLLGRHAFGDRYADAGGDGNLAGGLRSRRAWSRIARASGCLWPIASRTMWPCWTRRPARKRSGWLAGRGASYLTLSPDGSRIYATHVYPNPPRVRTELDNRTAPESEITVIDAARAVVVDRMPLHAIAGVFHLAFSADGRLGVVAEYHPKNLVPLAHLEHGGAFAYTLTLFGADVGKPVEVPLDELERYASQPFGVAIAPDKSRIYVTCGGSEMVTVIDVQRLLHFIHARPRRCRFIAQDLSASANYVVARIPVGHDPRGLALSRDGRRLFVANRLDDTISVIDTRTQSRGRDD